MKSDDEAAAHGVGLLATLYLIQSQISVVHGSTKIHQRAFVPGPKRVSAPKVSLNSWESFAVYLDREQGVGVKQRREQLALCEQ